MDMKRALILLAVILVASGCAQLGGSDADVPAETQNQENPEEFNESENETEGNASEVSGEEHIVYYTSEGFQPQSITIQQGDTVTWINNASTSMWVGSNNHPSHTQYDGTSTTLHCNNGESDTFDQCSAGDRYSFTFSKTGDWGYHNHHNQFDTGTVVVE